MSAEATITAPVPNTAPALASTPTSVSFTAEELAGISAPKSPKPLTHGHHWHLPTLHREKSSPATPPAVITPTESSAPETPFAPLSRTVTHTRAYDVAKPTTPSHAHPEHPVEAFVERMEYATALGYAPLAFQPHGEQVYMSTHPSEVTATPPPVPEAPNKALDHTHDSVLDRIRDVAAFGHPQREAKLHSPSATPTPITPESDAQVNHAVGTDGTDVREHRSWGLHLHHTHGAEHAEEQAGERHAKEGKHESILDKVRDAVAFAYPPKEGGSRTSSPPTSPKRAKSPKLSQEPRGQPIQPDLAFYLSM